jgi:hypothetical protein
MKKLLVLLGLAALAAVVVSALRGRGVDHGVDVSTPVAVPKPTPKPAPKPAPTAAAGASADDYEDAVVDSDDGDDTNDEPDLGAIDEPAAALAEEAAEVPMPIEKADPAPPKK